MPQERCFQLIKKGLKGLPPDYLFWGITPFCHRQMRQNFIFHCIFVWHFVHHWGVFLGFTAQRHKLLSIYRCTKSQVGFNVYAVKHTGFICMARLTRLARITRLTSFTRFPISTRNPRLTSPTNPICLLKTAMLCCRPSLANVPTALLLFTRCFLL